MVCTGIGEEGKARMGWRVGKKEEPPVCFGPTSPQSVRQADDGKEADPEATRRLGANKWEEWEECEKVEACRRAGDGNHGPSGFFFFPPLSLYIDFAGSTIWDGWSGRD